MSNKNSDIVMTVLKALLRGQTLNRKDFNNGSLHSWISTLRNQRFIPIESSEKNIDRTCNYYMLADEIRRYQDPMLRKLQRAEMKFIVGNRRRQQAIKKLEKATALNTKSDE
ncbi:MAG: hypothetical protein Q8R79_02980 [Legionellaceae bacterium]|nr:hypothetical protein [Legionellaceae bacterium]